MLAHPRESLSGVDSVATVLAVQSAALEATGDKENPCSHRFAPVARRRRVAGAAAPCSTSAAKAMTSPPWPPSERRSWRRCPALSPEPDPGRHGRQPEMTSSDRGHEGRRQLLDQGFGTRLAGAAGQLHVDPGGSDRGERRYDNGTWDGVAAYCPRDRHLQRRARPGTALQLAGLRADAHDFAVAYVVAHREGHA